MSLFLTQKCTFDRIQNARKNSRKPDEQHFFDKSSSSRVRVKLRCNSYLPIKCPILVLPMTKKNRSLAFKSGIFQDFFRGSEVVNHGWPRLLSVSEVRSTPFLGWTLFNGSGTELFECHERDQNLNFPHFAQQVSNKNAFKVTKNESITANAAVPAACSDRFDNTAMRKSN